MNDDEKLQKVIDWLAARGLVVISTTELAYLRKLNADSKKLIKRLERQREKV